MSNLDAWKLNIFLSDPKFPSPHSTSRVYRFFSNTPRSYARLGIFLSRGLMEYHWAYNLFTISMKYLKIYWQPVLVLIFYLAFGQMPNQIQDVALMIFMSNVSL